MQNNVYFLNKFFYMGKYPYFHKKVFFAVVVNLCYGLKCVSQKILTPNTCDGDLT